MLQSSSASADEDETTLDASGISFGALAKAQASLESSRGKGDSSEAHNSRQDDAGAKAKTSRKPNPKRSSKHAPQEMSSKRPVSRIDRDRLATAPKPQARDPRFSTLTAGSNPSSKADGSRQKLDELKAERNYAFLEAYRDSEVATLRTALKRSKSAAEREQLTRAVASMESRKAARQRRREEDEVVSAHRRREKELVRQGKKPFYLKRSEQKKRALVDRFSGMSDKQVDKAIGKRRKKAAAKERKEVGPLVRRERGGEESMP